MPYIKTEKRQLITPAPKYSTTGRVEMRHIDCAGDLNYAFTMLIIDYLERKGLNYQNINDVVGALEGAKLEVYRRVASTYEDLKATENGDVYPWGETPKQNKNPSVSEFNGA